METKVDGYPGAGGPWKGGRGTLGPVGVVSCLAGVEIIPNDPSVVKGCNSVPLSDPMCTKKCVTPV